MSVSGLKSGKSDNPKGRGRQRAESANPTGNRILRALDGRERKWLAGKSGIAESTISDYIKRGITKIEAAVSIAEALNVSVDWLLLGGRDDRAVADPADAAEQLGLIKVDEVDLALGMGATYLDEQAVESVERWVPLDWVRSFTDAPASMLTIARPIGDSMYPTINDRDIIMFDRSARRIDRQDAIWVLAYGGLGTIKRVRILPDGGMKLMADNPQVREEIAHDGEVHVIGRVVGVMRRI